MKTNKKEIKRKRIANKINKMLDTKQNALIYVRASGEDFEENISNQIDFLIGYGKLFNEISIVKRIGSASGKKHRKHLEDTLKFAEKNKINTLICVDSSRLFRDMETFKIIDYWFKKNSKATIHFPEKDGLTIYEN